MQRKTLLVTLAIVAIVVSAFLYFLLQPKTPGQAPVQTPTQPTQPAQPIVNATKPQQSQNATQAQTQPQPRQPAIIATIEASKGGRVLVNGTDTTTWNSTKPFKLVLEAEPERCMTLDYWLVNDTRLSRDRLNLTIAGNTTIKAFFTKATYYTVEITSNSSDAVSIVTVNNEVVYTLPVTLRVNACSTIAVKPWETQELRPLNGTLKVTVERDTTLRLFFQLKVQPLGSLPVYINGTLTEAKTWRDPFFESRGTIEVTSDGWIHLVGNPLVFFIYIPPNYTHVNVTVRDVAPPPTDPGLTAPIEVIRFCDWGTSPFAYGKVVPIHVKKVTIVFTGCYTQPWNTAVTGRRYIMELPGAIEIDLYGEAWIKIEASP
jgi:hypothetical protein